MLGVNEQTMNLFFRKRTIEETDLVQVTASSIKEVLSETAMKTFLSSPTIKQVADLNPGSQRVIINKYFGDVLLIARADKQIVIKEAFPLLINDGTVQDWATLIRTVILPFIKKHHIKLSIL